MPNTFGINREVRGGLFSLLLSIIGNTADFGSAIRGSNPRGATNLK